MALVIGGGGPNATGTYRLIRESANRADAITAATYILGINAQTGPQLASGGTAGQGVFYIDPADYAVSGKTTKLRLRLLAITNATAPACTFTAGLYPVTASAGASGNVTVTLGTVTAGSTAAIATPALSTLTQANSGDVTCPAAGMFAVAVVIDTNMAAGSNVGLRVQLEVRNV